MKKKLMSGFMVFLTSVLVACGSAEETTEASSEGNDKLAEVVEKGELNVGIAPGFPPYEFYVLDENGDLQIAGSDTDLAQAIADELGVDLVYTATDFNGVIANIQSGTVDMGISGFTYTDKRAEVMQFSKGYLQEASGGYQGLMVHEDLVDAFTNLDEIKEAGLVLGAQGGSIQYELAQSLTDASNVKQYATLDVGLAALNEGDIEAMVVSTTSAEPMLITFPDLAILPQEAFDLDPERVYSTNVIAFPLGAEYESLIEVANEVIEENKANGNIAKWHEEATALSREAVE